MRAMIIDFHTHIVSPKMKRERDVYVSRDACFGELYTQPKSKLFTAEDLLESMDECGVEKSVILGFGLMSSDMCLEFNDYIIECIARYPNRLIGFCTVQPLDTRGAIREIERCAKHGARGIGEVRPDTQGFDLRDIDLMGPLVEAMIEYNLIFLTHASEPVGHEYYGKGSVTPEKIYPFILTYPELRIVLAHWGGGLPFYALMPEVDKALANCYFDTAATPFLYKPQVFEHVTDIVGSERILFGSDNPLLSPKRIVDQVESLNLKPVDRERIFFRNAKTLLGI